jgi:hypothetical protein
MENTLLCEFWLISLAEICIRPELKISVIMCIPYSLILMVVENWQFRQRSATLRRKHKLPAFEYALLFYNHENAQKIE